MSLRLDTVVSTVRSSSDSPRMKLAKATALNGARAEKTTNRPLQQEWQTHEGVTSTTMSGLSFRMLAGG